ncbi:MAG TPA: cupin domain-containing protein [Nitrososphaera sp.]
MTLHAIGGDGELSKIKIGRSLEPQAITKAGMWFTEAVYDKKSYCLLGCTMSPGFDYRGWELAKRD